MQYVSAHVDYGESITDRVFVESVLGVIHGTY